MIKFPPKRILVPMDDSAPSFSALESAKALARKFGASLDIVYVKSVAIPAPAFYPAGVIAGFPEIPGVQESYARWCMKNIRKAAKGFPASRFHLRTVIGEPAAVLAGLARARTADFVVMGTHGYGGVERAIYGSVAEAVISRASVPVLTALKGAPMTRISKILVPFNLTPYAEKTLEYVLKFARGWGAKIHVLYVIPESADWREAYDRLNRALERVAGHKTAEKLELRVSIGDPREVIFETSRRGKFDLVALSAHRRPFSSDFVLGSTVERVLRHSKIPVLAVPSAARRRWKDVQLSIGGVPGNRVLLPV